MFDLNKNDFTVLNKLLKSNVYKYTLEVNKVINSLKKEKNKTDKKYAFSIHENLYNMIIDYYKIDEKFGNWKDLNLISKNKNIMIDI